MWAVAAKYCIGAIYLHRTVLQFMARNTRFCHFLQKHYGRTDGRMDGPTDGYSLL